MSISTVIVIAWNTPVGYLLFSACEERNTKKFAIAVASMASVAKCLLVRALALPATLLKLAFSLKLQERKTINENQKYTDQSDDEPKGKSAF